MKEDLLDDIIKESAPYTSIHGQGQCLLKSLWYLHFSLALEEVIKRSDREFCYVSNLKRFCHDRNVLLNFLCEVSNLRRHKLCVTHLTQPQQTGYSCSETKDVTITRQSKWRQKWKDLRENNPLSNSEC